MASNIDIELDKIADKLRHCYYYVDYHANKTQTEINVDIENVVKEEKQKLKQLINSIVLEELESIANKNYCEELGTYDFDGVAELVLTKIEDSKRAEQSLQRRLGE